MDIEPLPKVTFLPAQLTSLVIDGWTGDIIDYQKNGQVSLKHIQRDARFVIDLQSVPWTRHVSV